MWQFLWFLDCKSSSSHLWHNVATAYEMPVPWPAPPSYYWWLECDTRMVPAVDWCRESWTGLTVPENRKDHPLATLIDCTPSCSVFYGIIYFNPKFELHNSFLTVKLRPLLKAPMQGGAFVFWRRWITLRSSRMGQTGRLPPTKINDKSSPWLWQYSYYFASVKVFQESSLLGR